jgi:glycerophosphoryl diester phosphodiesterase
MVRRRLGLFTDPSLPVLLFGHRGYSALAPENTLAAFQLLVDRGIPGAELDVQLSRDEAPVVVHDFDLKRTTGMAARVHDVELSTIRSLDAGSWFAPEFRGQGVPLLDEVLGRFGRRLYFDVELKWDRGEKNGLEERVIEVIRRHGLQDRCLLSSFNPLCILRARRLAPEIPTAHIWSHGRELPFILRHGEAALLAPAPLAKPEGARLRGWNAALLRLLGSRLVAWGVEEPEEALRLLRLGVRGLISNDPGRLKEALDYPRAVRIRPGRSARA